MESSLRMAWNEIRHRAVLIKSYAGVPAVEASESRLGQVFLNIVMNAVQALGEDNGHANEIRISTRVEGGRVVVEIGDTGTGIAPEVMKRLFTPFVTTKPVGVGTGLGLSICHRIVSDLGGAIGVETEVGVGTVFTISLPVSEAVTVAAAPAPKAAEPAEPGPRGKVLVVDDEPMLGRLVEGILGDQHQVTIAGGAQEALSRIKAGERYDVILCDLMMPEKTGVDLYEDLEREAPDQARRIVFMTGGAFTPKARAFLDGIPNPTVEKPFSSAQLRSLVSERLAGAERG
jgi:CheY-like chemotaxis protein